MATHSSALAWKIPWTEEPGRLQSMESLRVGHDWLSDFHVSLSCIGEGNGNPLQCSCLENPRDGGAWWAAVYGVAQSRTRLKRFSSSSSHCPLVKENISMIKKKYHSEIFKCKSKNQDKHSVIFLCWFLWQQYTFNESVSVLLRDIKIIIIVNKCLILKCSLLYKTIFHSHLYYLLARVFLTTLTI